MEVVTSYNYCYSASKKQSLRRYSRGKLEPNYLWQTMMLTGIEKILEVKMNSRRQFRGGTGNK